MKALNMPADDRAPRKQSSGLYCAACGGSIYWTVVPGGFGPREVTLPVEADECLCAGGPVTS